MRPFSRTLAGASLVFCLLAGAAQAAETYGFDKGHSEIVFKWNHAGLSTQSGEFRNFDGKVEIDRLDIEKSKVHVTIKVDSLHTGVAALDKMLKGPDFFDAKKHPHITFKSTHVKRTAVGHARITGDLTIRGITHPVELDVKLNYDGEHPLASMIAAYAGAQYLGFSGHTTVLRSEFDVGKFAPLTSDRVEISIETELRKE